MLGSLSRFEKKNFIRNGMKKNIIISLVLLFILNMILSGLDPKQRINKYLIDNWTNKNGLPQNSVTAIIQTRQGYLWLGTQEGVVRFDGINMTTFNIKNVPEFKSSMITSLIEGKNGLLWIGTYEGLMKYNNNKFDLLTVENGLTSNLIRCLRFDDKSDLWVGTDNGVVKHKNGSFIKYPLPITDGSNYITSMILDIDKNLLISTKDELYKLVDEKFISLNFQDDLKSEISTLYMDQVKNIWIGTVNKGLFKKTSGKLIRFEGNDKLSGNYITTIAEDKQNNLWIGTQNGGLNRIYNNEISSFSEKSGMSKNFIQAILEDKEKNLWIGKASSGLSRLRDGKVSVYGPSDGIISDIIRTVFEDSQGTLWIGSNQGEIYKKQGDTFISIDGKDVVKGNVVRSIMEGPEGNIWIGTIGSGLCIVKGDKIEKFAPAHSLPSDQIYSLFKGSDGVMWVGTGSGIGRYENGVFKNYVSAGGAAINAVRGMAEDHQKNIWFQIEGRGLAKFDGKEFVFTDMDDGLSSNIVTGLYFDDQNIAWVGTIGGGLNWIDSKGINHITIQNGLHDNVIYTILEDAGKLWMSCNNGIFYIEKEQLFEFAAGRIDKVTCVAFNESSGMKNRECNGGNYPAGWNDRNGILWFPTVKGLVKIDPKNIKQDDEFPPILIEKIIVDGKEIDLKKGKIVPPGYKRIEFQYTALSFTNPKDIKFRVRLKGVEKEWVNMDIARKTYYTLVPPGKYTFEVSSTNGEGIWNNISVSLEIYLKPFFYQTNTFLVIVGLFLILITFLFFQFRFRALNKRKTELEIEVKNRTIELRQKNIELEKLSIVARETNNSVIISGVDGTIEWVNEGFIRMYGYTLEQLIKEIGDNVLSFSLREDFKEIFNKCVTEKKPFSYESSSKTRNGKIIWTQTAITPIMNEELKIKQLVFVETDISKLKQAYDKMKEMSLTDPLTKLKNRRYFHNLIERDVQISRRKLFKKAKAGLVYSMLFLMIDIDYFKKVNDKYGHNAGDQLLIQISDRMKNTLRTSDLLVRWGGEEFLVMSKDDNFEGARLLSMRLLKAIEEEAFNLDGIKVDITISIGYCGFPILPNDPNQLGWENIIHLADSALYIAKNDGRKRSAGVKIIEEKITDSNAKMLKDDFEKAIKEGIVEIITSKTDS